MAFVDPSYEKILGELFIMAVAFTRAIQGASYKLSYQHNIGSFAGKGRRLLWLALSGVLELDKEGAITRRKGGS